MPTLRPRTPLSRRSRRKSAASKSTGTVAVAGRKATTVRLEPTLISGLSLLQRVLKKPMNRMVNEAVRRYVEHQSAEVETNLEKTLERVQAYRRSDPNYEKLWDEFVDAEARYGKDDPLEGRIKSPRPKTRVKKAGPVQTRVRDMLSR
jgi:predicted transcriptional regulator